MIELALIILVFKSVNQTFFDQTNTRNDLNQQKNLFEIYPLNLKTEKKRQNKRKFHA